MLNMKVDMNLLAFKMYTKLKNAKRKFSVFIILSFSVALTYPLLIFSKLPVASQGLGYLIKHVFLRIFYKPAINSHAAFEVFPNLMNFTYFHDISLYAKVFDFVYIPMSSLIASYRGMTEMTQSPPAAVGNFYAQGGWVVIIGGVLLASVIFRCTEYLILTINRKTVLQVSLYSLLIYAAFRFSWANFHTILFTESIMPLVLTYFVWFFLVLVPKLLCSFNYVNTPEECK
jgi:hypothetical protein